MHVIVHVHSTCTMYMYNIHVYQCTCTIYMYINVHVHVCVYEQSYYIVHYIRRKEEGKEGRKKRTNTDNLKGRDMYRHMRMCGHREWWRHMYMPTLISSSTCRSGFEEGPGSIGHEEHTCTCRYAII